jgi:hypothetical protein
MYSKEESKELKIAFWDTFNKKASKIRRAEGKQKKWMLDRTGIRPVRLKFDTGNDFVSVGIYIQSKHEDIRLRYYEKFHSMKEIMESEIEGLKWELIYDTEEGTEISRISCQLDGVNFMNKKDWDQIFDFFITKMNSFEEIIEEYRDYVKSRMNE